MEAWSKNCCCIEKLFIFSHGWAYKSVSGQGHKGGFYAATATPDDGFYGHIRREKDGKKKDNAKARSIDDIGAGIREKRINFCKPCQIILTGCRVASTSNFANRLAATTGCTVKAASGGCSPTGVDGQFSSGPGSTAERNQSGSLPWQQFIPSTTTNPTTGQTTVTVTQSNIGGTITLW